MSDKLGDFVLVLHGHLPYVLHHGVWPHGEDWLYEAAAETYMPILSVIDEIHHLGGWPGITLGLTPVLLEQLAHERFKNGFVEYLADRVEQVRSDQREFERHNDGHMVYLANWWAEFYAGIAAKFEDIGRDIPGAYAQKANAGSIEILTSNATHGYMPLLLEDSSIRAQSCAGLATSKRLLGFQPTGMWLPECAYRPANPWRPPVVYGDLRNRIGIEHLVADEGITHFFVESHLLENSRSEGVYENGVYHKVGWDEGRNIRAEDGIRSTSRSGATPMAGLDARSCMHAIRISANRSGRARSDIPRMGYSWSSTRNTASGAGFGIGRSRARASTWASSNLTTRTRRRGRSTNRRSTSATWSKSRLAEHKHRTGRPGVVVACFDAELFGHWWFEGPRFLRDVLLSLHHDPQVNLMTSKERTREKPPDKVASMPEGSWGDSGDHRVWMNEQTRWIWEVEYRAEALFGKMTFNLPWRNPANVKLRGMMEKAGRELLLMQASDWPFVITRGQAIDYGIKRFVLHAGRFENLISIAERVARNETLSPIEEFEVQDSDLHDSIFPNIDLNWWNM